MVTDHGLAGLAFADKGDEQAALSDMYSRWPRANYQQDDEATRPFAAHIFNPHAWQQEQPLRITLIGTDFEVRVWEMLLKIPLGNMTTYSTIARHMGKAQGRPGGGLCGWSQPHFLCRALPSCGGQRGLHLRLSLGPHAQAGNPWLGTGLFGRQ